MIKITAIASSSKGNLYILDNGKTRLVLECGLPWKQVQKALGFDLSDVSGVLLSHGHSDHSKAVIDVAKAGLDIYLSKGTAEEIRTAGHRIHHIKSQQQFQLDDWSIMPFETIHDSAEPLGFLIASGKDKLLFITDSAYCRYKFKGITLLMIETNFSNEIINRYLAQGLIDDAWVKRLRRSHFSLERVKEFLIANDLSKLKMIFLLHLSDLNSDATEFKKQVQSITGVPVYVTEE